MRCILAALAACLAAGCASPGLGPAQPLDDPAGIPPNTEAAARRGLAKPPWPPSVMTHRAILTIGGSQASFDGRLAVGADGALRLVALGAWGGVAFDVLLAPGAPPRVLRVAPPLRAEWVCDFAARDVETIFRAPPAGARWRWGSVRDERTWAAAARIDETDGSEIRYLFDPRSAAPRWTRVERIRDGRCLYRVAVLESRDVAGGAGPVPSSLRVEAESYALDLRLVEFKPGPPPARLFRAEDPPK
jgi:hypothetical protein